MKILGYVLFWKIAKDIWMFRYVVFDTCIHIFKVLSDRLFGVATWQILDAEKLNGGVIASYLFPVGDLLVEDVLYICSIYVINRVCLVHNKYVSFLQQAFTKGADTF